MHIQRRGLMLIFLKILIARLKSFIKVKMFENMPKLGWCMNLTQRRNVLCFRSSMAAILLKIQTSWIWVNHRGDRSSEQFSCSNRIKFVDKQATDLSISDEKQLIVSVVQARKCILLFITMLCKPIVICLKQSVQLALEIIIWFQYRDSISLRCLSTRDYLMGEL